MRSNKINNVKYLSSKQQKQKKQKKCVLYKTN